MAALEGWNGSERHGWHRFSSRGFCKVTFRRGSHTASTSVSGASMLALTAVRPLAERRTMKSTVPDVSVKMLTIACVSL